MNIETVSFDLFVNIFSYIPVHHLILSMSVCRSFASIIDKIIKEVIYDDMYEYLFVINSVKITTIRRYLERMVPVTDTKIAGLILAAVVTNNFELANEIAAKSVKLTDYQLLGTDHDFFMSTFFLHNRFFNQIIERINFSHCFKQWVRTIINVNRLDIFDHMYLHSGAIKYDIFHYAQSMISKEGMQVVDNHIKMALYNGEIHIFDYYCRYYFLTTESNYVCNKIYQFQMYILYGGHLDLFLRWINCANSDFRSLDMHVYHKLIITCLLRCNHIEQYQKYSATVLLNPHFQIINQSINLDDFLIELPVTDCITLDPITSTTIDFCMQEFKINIDPEKIEKYIS